MTNDKIQINDPRLTAYALGELSGPEAKAVKDAIGNDPELLAFVEETKETAAFLSGELELEAQPRLSPEQREKLLPETKKSWFALNRWTYSGLGLVAAGIVAVLVMPRVMQSSLDRRMPEMVRDFEEPQPKQPAFAEKQDSASLKESRVSPQQAAKIEGRPAASAGNGASLNQAYEAEVDSLSLEDTSAGAAFADRAVMAPSEYKAKKAMSANQVYVAPASPAKTFGTKGGISAGAAGGGAASLMARERVEMPMGKVAACPAGVVGCLPHPMPEPYIPPTEGSSGESYSQIIENPWIKPTAEPLSTFSIDVDTASYANVRRMLNAGQLPPKDAVRIEELVNYFPYNYAPPTDGKPFAVHVEMAETPWTEGNQLVRIALRGKDIAPKERPKLNLCFLIDVSGSMDEPNKLPLVQESLKLLVDQMQDQDRISLVVYAGASGLVLPPTSGDSRRKIKDAIDNLKAGGSTNGGAGIQLAYDTLQTSFIKGGVNRVILASDGDFNVGITNESDLVKLIEEKAKGGSFLSVLGFGMGNYKDSNMMKLSDKGNGNYAYIDTLAEAKKALVEQMAGTLITIAKDVKIQVEFNPAYVAAYRLVGYEKRLLNKEDFNDDTKDAGEIGSGHTVTAFYEVVPAGKAAPGSVDALKYQKAEKKEEAKAEGVKNGEALTVKLRYKDPDGSASKLIEVPVKHDPKAFTKASGEFQFAASVAGFGMLLRDSSHKGVAGFEPIAATAAKHTEVKGKESEHRKEFVELVRKAAKLKQPWKSAE